jgi:hypothetical protein
MIQKFIQSTPTIDFNHPAVAEFVLKHAGDNGDPVKQAVSLYYSVRDNIRYDPYSIDLTVEGLCASTTIINGRGDFDDVPIDAIIETFMKEYAPDKSLEKEDFEKDVEKEVSR